MEAFESQRAEGTAASEELIPLARLPELLPPRPNGRRAHRSLGYRWARLGVAGVRLPIVAIGNASYVRRTALEQFVADVTARRGSTGATLPQHCPATPLPDEVDAALDRELR